jgi:hypothetical protein
METTTSHLVKRTARKPTQIEDKLRKRMIPKIQKLKLNATVYKIHTGYIYEFDPKDVFYKIKYQDGDIEEGTEEEISRLLKKPNQTAWKQALSATIFERTHAQ